MDKISSEIDNLKRVSEKTQQHTVALLCEVVGQLTDVVAQLAARVTDLEKTK